MGSLAKQSVYSGNIIELKVKGQKVGRAQGLDSRISFGTEGIYELGSTMPQEHVHLKYEGTLTVEKFYVRQSSLNNLETPLGEEVLTTDILDIEVFDKVTGELIQVYRGCSIVDTNINFRVGTITAQNASFTYLEASKNQDVQGGLV